MQFFRGCQWWDFRCEMGIFPLSALMTGVGLAVGIGCAMAVDAPYLIPVCAAIGGLAPFCILPEERVRRDLDFARRFLGSLRLLLAAFLVAALWTLWDEIAAFPIGVCLVVTCILGCVFLVYYTVWGLILAFRGDKWGPTRTAADGHESGSVGS